MPNRRTVCSAANLLAFLDATSRGLVEAGEEERKRASEIAERVAEAEVRKWQARRRGRIRRRSATRRASVRRALGAAPCCRRRYWEPPACLVVREVFGLGRDLTWEFLYGERDRGRPNRRTVFSANLLAFLDATSRGLVEAGEEERQRASEIAERVAEAEFRKVAGP